MTDTRKRGRQHGQTRAPARSGKRKARMHVVAVGRRVLLQIDIRPELKRVLQARAMGMGMTLQAFVLSILRDAGLPVRRDDLLDRRKPENRASKPMPAEARHPKQRRAPGQLGWKAQPPSRALLERLGLEGIDGVGPCIVVVNVDGGRLRKRVRKRVAKSKPRRRLARRRK